MFICPTCGKGFTTEKGIQKHFLSCWKQHNPVHKSKSAPHSKDIVTREVNEDVMNFFKELNNARSND